MEPARVGCRQEAAGAAVTERFKPGGVLHALVSGLLELALAAVLLAGSLLAGDGNAGVATSLEVAAVLWAVLGLYGLVTALLRARVLEAELDEEAVVLHGISGARRFRYDELSAVEVSRGRTRLVGRDGRLHTVRGVRGPAQGNRFRARVLARATEAAERAGVDRRAAGDAASPDTLPDARGSGGPAKGSGGLKSEVRGGAPGGEAGPSGSSPVDSGSGGLKSEVRGGAPEREAEPSGSPPVDRGSGGPSE